MPIKLRVVSQPAALPTCKSCSGANPQTPVPRDAQASNVAAGETLARWRLPRGVPHAVEAKQSEFRAEPEIAVGRLGNRKDDAFGKAFLDFPSGVRVLTDVERLVQCENTWARCQQDG